MLNVGLSQIMGKYAELYHRADPMHLGSGSYETLESNHVSFSIDDSQGFLEKPPPTNWKPSITKLSAFKGRINNRLLQ